MPRLNLFCNCPDASAQKPGDPTARYSSDMAREDWSDGFNGVRANHGYCKHEWAVLRIRKEIDDAGGVPKDVPVNSLEIKSRAVYKQKVQKVRLFGNDVS